MGSRHDPRHDRSADERVWAGREGGRGLLAGGGALPKSLSALRQAQRDEEKEEWGRRWTFVSTGAGLREVDPGPPGSGTKWFLALDDPERLCASCGVPETRRHYLLDCPHYQQQRQRLRRDLDGRRLSLPLLFAPSSTNALLRYIHATERFPRLYATLAAGSDA
ncbi:hypothetical protein JCM10207_006973 [Rhodosporidiobolus poonsookiae]